MDPTEIVLKTTEEPVLGIGDGTLTYAYWLHLRLSRADHDVFSEKCEPRAEHFASVHVEYEGQIKEWTLDEFLTLLGFEV